jgi:hypothetical protein
MPNFAQLHFGGDMYIDPALLSPVSALMGALIGGSTSLVAAVYTQRHQDRLQRVASEVTKRETVYADFVMSASNLVLTAYTHDEIVLSDDERRLIGLMNRMRLFAPPDVIRGAEAVLRAIVEISLKPSVELRQLAKEALSKSLDPDPLLVFSSICRADLDKVHRTVM